MSPSRAITDSTPVKLPIRVWLGALALAASAGVAWFSLKADTAVNTTEIAQVKQDNKDMRQEQRELREIVIRIDENVKQLRRDSRTGRAP